MISVLKIAAFLWPKNFKWEAFEKQFEVISHSSFRATSYKCRSLMHKISFNFLISRASMHQPPSQLELLGAGRESGPCPSHEYLSLCLQAGERQPEFIFPLQDLLKKITTSHCLQYLRCFFNYFPQSYSQSDFQDISDNFTKYFVTAFQLSSQKYLCFCCPPPDRLDNR